MQNLQHQKDSLRKFNISFLLICLKNEETTQSLMMSRANCHPLETYTYIKQFVRSWRNMNSFLQLDCWLSVSTFIGSWRDSRVVDAYIILEGGRIHLLTKELDGQTNYMDKMPCLLLKFAWCLMGTLGKPIGLLGASPPTAVQWLYTIFWIKYSSQVVWNSVWMSTVNSTYNALHKGQ